jgi:hypothetical protein
MKLKLEIELGNDAMTTPLDVLEAVGRSLDNRINDDEPLTTGLRNIVRDVNGNTVGSWHVIDIQTEKRS